MALLKEQNGGYIRYKLPETPPMQLWGIGQAYPRLMRLADELDESLSSELNLALDGLIAFDGDGHYYHCLDYRQNQTQPQVCCIDIEGDSEELVAESFDEFLQLLLLDTQDLYAIKTDLSLAEVVAQFKKQLTISFGLPETDDYGYESYKGKFGGHWLFLRTCIHYFHRQIL